jgi:hypothetical protein
MKLIESKTLASAAASIEFTSIPQDATDLVVLVSVRTVAGDPYAMYISFNGSTSNFSARYLYGSGSTTSSGTLARYIGSVSATYTANTFNNGAIYIPNYSGSTNKSYSVDQVTENNATLADQNLIAGLWTNTAAITSLAISPSANEFAIGSTVSLYKITKGSDGIVTTS